MRTGRISYSLASVAVALWCSGAFGGQITLLDGTVLKGGYPIFLSTVGPKVPRPAPDKSLNLAIVTLSEAGAVRFYVPRLQVKGELDRSVDLKPAEHFKLKEEKRPRSKEIEQVAGQLEATPWDAFGHRRVSFKSGERKLDLMQEIVELTPKYVTVTAMDYLWEFGMPTSSIPPDALDKILHQATKRDNLDDRFAIARFYMEGEFYALAQKELESIQADFPDRANQVNQVMLLLKQLLANQTVDLLEERRLAGQHQLAYDTAQKFLALNIPDISPATIQKLKRSIAEADAERNKLEDIRQTLGLLQAKLTPEQAAEVAPLRTEIAENLHVETVIRLAPFINLAEADDRKPAEKLALALTGWVLGADQADTDFKTAIRLWQARGLLIEYLRTTNSTERADIVQKLSDIEGVGPKQIARMIPLLPPRSDTPNMTSGTPFTVESQRHNVSDDTATYEVLLPLEYHPGRSYPVVVVLHGEGVNSQTELKWWARQAQRFGYILLAPNYIDPGQRTYDYSLDAHYAVTETIRDARHRFNIDSDRIFLGGHGIGGDATFDIGYSHPDLFAGIMPITAICEKFSKVYWENAKHLPQFIIAGELDRTATEDNCKVIDHMMLAKLPLIYAVFTGRGHEDFHSEDGRLFDWMSRQRRGKPPVEVDINTARTTDNQFWWWTFSNFPSKFGITSWPANERTQAKPIVLNATARRAKGANVININCAAKWHSLWLFPEVVSFEKILTVRHGATQLYHQIPEPDIKAMVEDFRLRGDRQQIAWGHLELGSKATGANTGEAKAASARIQRLSLRAK